MSYSQKPAREKNAFYEILRKICRLHSIFLSVSTLCVSVYIEWTIWDTYGDRYIKYLGECLRIFPKHTSDFFKWKGNVCKPHLIGSNGFLTHDTEENQNQNHATADRIESINQ